MKVAIWLASFVYLAAISAWITTEVKTEAERHGAVRFFVLICVGTLAFCAAILLTQRIF